MRVILCVACASLLLSACQHFSTLTPSDFSRGTASRVKFERDNYNCQVEATVKQNLAGGGDIVGVYNDAYVDCMKHRGYATTDIDLLGFSG